MSEPHEMMVEIGKGIELSQAGERAAAHQVFAEGNYGHAFEIEAGTMDLAAGTVSAVRRGVAGAGHLTNPGLPAQLNVRLARAVRLTTDVRKSASGRAGP